MRFNCKSLEYQGKEPNQGFFKNAYVETHATLIDVKQKRLTVSFHLVYNDENDVKHIIEDSPISFFENSVDTFILNSNDEPEEILSFIANGGVYDLSRIHSWGTPSFDSVQDYFELTSVWTDLEFKEQPLKQLAIDWVLYNVNIQGHILNEEFEYIN